MQDFNHKHYNYRWTKGFILATCIAAVLLVSAVYAQVTDSYTNNLVNNTTTANTAVSTWQNAGTINQPITCWKPGDPGYCGPLPYVNGFGSDNSINFSYGMTEIYQMVNVGKALPNGGSGLVNTGYVFSFLAKNGNGWDDGRQDVLKAQVTLYGPNNAKVLEQHSYDLNSVFSWTNFSYNVNWSTTKVGYRENQVGNVKFGFYGMDNNFWAGPYGPEISDINFRLKYKPDPCIKNPLFSPECPKFTDALSKTTSTTTSTTSDNQNVTNTEYNNTNTSSEKKTSKFDDNIDDRDDMYENDIHDMNKLIDTLIKIHDNQTKEEKITMDAAKDAIQETDKKSQQTLKQAEQVASKLTKESIANSLAPPPIMEMTKQDKSSQSLLLFQEPTTTTFGTFQLPNSQQQNILLQPTQTNQSTTLGNEQPYKAPQQSATFGSVSTGVVEGSILVFAPLQNLQTNNNFTNNTNLNNNFNSQNGVSNPFANQLVDIPLSQSNFLTNKADPLNAVLEAKNKLEDKKQEQTTTAVRSNVQDNDAAGGVSLTQIAVTPIGYNQYVNFVLKDAAFYAPKEIYRGQKTIDNNRALRQLASDKLHQQMVDQQYRR
jgi:hypothetical protein